MLELERQKLIMNALLFGGVDLDRLEAGTLLVDLEHRPDQNHHGLSLAMVHPHLGRRLADVQARLNHDEIALVLRGQAVIRWQPLR